jgi:ATPase subunit of ABC transporter with duplicated ATPase domains
MRRLGSRAPLRAEEKKNPAGMNMAARCVRNGAGGLEAIGARALQFVALRGKPAAIVRTCSDPLHAVASLPSPCFSFRRSSVQSAVPRHARPLGSITATEITKHYGASVALDSVSLSVRAGDRVGVVGPNGIGKSTLLRILSGVEEPDSGDVRRSPAATPVGYLPQEPDAVQGESLGAYLARRTGVADAERRLERAQLAIGDGLDAIAAYNEALEWFLALGGDSFRARAEVVLQDVHLTDVALDRPMTTLSGGQAGRALLAAILLARFDVFLLDEPTNNLDFDGLGRLERFFDEEAGGIVVVSHDRVFLERSILRVLEIEDGTHRAVEYSGGLRAYEQEQARRRQAQYEAYGEYVSQRGRLQQQARRQRTWATSGAAKAVRDKSEGDKFLRSGRRQSAENLAAKSSNYDRKLQRLEQVDKPWEGWDLRMSLGVPQRPGNVVVRLEDAVARRGDFVLGPLSLEIVWPEKVVVSGPNGAGKTTLLAVLLGELPLTAGRRYLGPGVVIGRLDQERSMFGEAALLDGWRAETDLEVAAARSLLAKFGLGADEVRRPGRTLSPGERTRASLALLTARGVNCLVLDEPTNHLDLAATEELESTLESFEGTVVLVTHDRRLLESFRASRTIAVKRTPPSPG